MTSCHFIPAARNFSDDNIRCTIFFYFFGVLLRQHHFFFPMIAG
uniref:Uncharacterized protein n=1 Tax=Rhizophora mucronata TaxID=61149 RepID=A0A2P2PSJ4_RHIMU